MSRHRHPDNRRARPTWLPTPTRTGLGVGVLAAVFVTALAAAVALGVDTAPDAHARDSQPPARSVQVTVSYQPAVIPSIGAEGAWDPEAAQSPGPLSAPVPSVTARATSVHAGATARATAATTASRTTPPAMTAISTTAPTPTTAPAATLTTLPTTTTTASATTTATATTETENPLPVDPSVGGE